MLSPLWLPMAQSTMRTISICTVDSNRVISP